MKSFSARISFLLLSAVLPMTAMAAAREDSSGQKKPSIEIDRSVLENLQGYKPPSMFNATTAPLTRKITPPPEAATLMTVPQAEEVLDFPVQNTEVLTRQRAKAPEEQIATARPDYSDSRTTLSMMPPAVKARKDKEDVAAVGFSSSKKMGKTPLPPRKPSINLASIKSPVVTESAKKFVALEPAAGIEGRPGLNDADMLPVPMERAAPTPRYVPKSRPTMPALPAAKVERAKLDAFSLPLIDDSDQLSGADAKPSPGDRLVDQALNSRMVDIDQGDIQSVLAGGKVDPTSPLLKLGALKADRIQKSTPVVLEFEPRLTNLVSKQEDLLKDEVLSRLKANPDQRLQIQAYASRNSNEESEARRLSLARALAVRAFLLENGIEASRMDIRALGSNTTEKAADRVDLIFMAQG